MAQDIQDWTQAVNVTGGTVAIGGTASVSIVGTPTVVISGTPTVNIGNTPSVVISSGSVTISNASIGVVNAPGSKITSSRPPLLLGNAFNAPANPQVTNFALPADIQALVLILPQALTTYVHVKVAWHPTGTPSLYVPLELRAFTQQVYVIPITPTAVDGQSNPTNSIDVTVEGAVLGNNGVLLYALFEPNPLWLEYFAPPFAEPNQPPISTNVVITAAATNYPIIAPVANVEIWLFTLALLSAQGFAAVTGISIGYGPDATHVTEMMTDDVFSSNAGGPSHILNFGGAPLGRGNGLYIHKAGGGGVGAWIDGTVTYSLG